MGKDITCYRVYIFQIQLLNEKFIFIMNVVQAFLNNKSTVKEEILKKHYFLIIFMFLKLRTAMNQE